MKLTATTLCYILPKGATQEQSCTWQDLKAQIESGELAPDTLMYQEESQQWVTLASLEEFDDALWERAAASRASVEEAVESDDLEELQKEYEEAVREARDRYDSIECLTRAARLALSLDRQDEALAQYQRALELQPFNKGLATEIKRSLPPVAYRTLSLLDRQPSFREDPLAALAYPLGMRPIPFAIATAALAFLSLVPLVRPLFWIALAMIVVRVAAEAGKRTVRSADGIMTDPRAVLADWKSFACFTLYGVTVVLPFALLSEVMLLAERAGHWNFLRYIQSSPLLTVALFVMSAVVAPVALMVSTNEPQEFRNLFSPKRMWRIVVSDDSEYLWLLAGMIAVALVWLGLRALVSFVPVVGEIIAAAAALYGALLIGYIAGRTRSRHQHLL